VSLVARQQQRCHREKSFEMRLHNERKGIKKQQGSSITSDSIYVFKSHIPTYMQWLHTDQKAFQKCLFETFERGTAN